MSRGDGKVGLRLTFEDLEFPEKGSWIQRLWCFPSDLRSGFGHAG